MMDGHGGLFGFFGGFMWIFWLLVIAGIVALVVFLTGGAGTGRTPPRQAGEDPLEILRRRYARGEIDEEEFNRRRAELEK